MKQNIREKAFSKELEFIIFLKGNWLLTVIIIVIVGLNVSQQWTYTSGEKILPDRKCFIQVKKYPLDQLKLVVYAHVSQHTNTVIADIYRCTAADYDLSCIRGEL